MGQQEKYALAARRLWSGSTHITRRLDNSLGAIHGIGLTEYMVLQQLAQSPTGALRRIDLADAVERTASGITRMLRPMEKIGLVEKDVSERDARVSLVRVTPAGQRVYEEASETVKQQSEALLSGLGARALDNFLDLLDAVPGT